MATSQGGEDLRIVGWETSHYTKVYKIPGPTHGLEKITLAVRDAYLFLHNGHPIEAPLKPLGNTLPRCSSGLERSSIVPP